jgi:hypothetical protein
MGQITNNQDTNSKQISIFNNQTICHSGAGQNPPSPYPPWIPAFAGMTYKLIPRLHFGVQRLFTIGHHLKKRIGFVTGVGIAPAAVFNALFLPALSDGADIEMAD